MPKKQKRRIWVRREMAMGQRVRENLPLPIVHYPNLCGTFIAFARDEMSEVKLCACAALPITNLIRLTRTTFDDRYSDSLRRAPLSNWYFPNIIARRSVDFDGEPFVELGFRQIGERWIRETLLFNIVKELFSNEEVLFHYRPRWLSGLEIDVFLPGRKVAIEYQGEQHFTPIVAWGGENALLALKERDSRKAQLCAQLGIRLIQIDYTVRLTVDNVRRLLNDTDLLPNPGRF